LAGRKSSWIGSHGRAGAEILRDGDLDSPKFKRNLRVNAGMSKVYSLICESFIIYDSRVVAALGWLVMKYCSDRKLTSS